PAPPYRRSRPSGEGDVTDDRTGTPPTPPDTAPTPHRHRPGRKGAFKGARRGVDTPRRSPPAARRRLTGRDADTMRVLIVEDDDAIATPLTKGLEREGLDVDRVETGNDALHRSAAAPFDVVLLDLGLPDRDGFDVCRELRARSDVPIIVVTARSEEVDRVVGLELGADDYIVKPFALRELVARIRAVARRRTPAAMVDDHAGAPANGSGANGHGANGAVIEVGTLAVD